MSMAQASVDSAILLATFTVDEEIYAIDASRVQEVIRRRAMTRVPHAPEAVLGVINLRGRIVTVFDTATLLGASGKPAGSSRSPESRIIIVSSQGEFAGLLVEKVTEVQEVESGSAEAAPANVGAACAPYLDAVYRLNGALIGVLNTEVLLAAEALQGMQRGLSR